ncbi:toxin-antitoxin system YwqK family antitoxin [Nocardia suismassiliense]|uniref:toxin-antitoxin system YwqK family antitoxin n=1 Tax=Nocardia suismassiliense TaxID=2077092 RepID=UPI000D1D783E|nr:hypothetical protein [Nocardia suismassiliense]
MTDSEPIDVDDPDADMSNEYSQMFYRGERYTGEAVERGADGTIIGLWTFVDGFEEGPSKSWYPDGAPKHTGMVARNRPVGEWREWYPDGRLQEVSVFDGPGKLVSRKKWDENGVLIDEIPRTGQPDAAGGAGAEGV